MFFRSKLILGGFGVTPFAVQGLFMALCSGVILRDAQAYVVLGIESESATCKALFLALLFWPSYYNFVLGHARKLLIIRKYMLKCMEVKGYGVTLES